MSLISLQVQQKGDHNPLTKGILLNVATGIIRIFSTHNGIGHHIANISKPSTLLQSSQCSSLFFLTLRQIGNGNGTHPLQKLIQESNQLGTLFDDNVKGYFVYSFD